MTVPVNSANGGSVTPDTAEAERERIVAWLRSDGPDRDNGGPCRHVEHVQSYCTCDELADAIERLAHHEPRS